MSRGAASWDDILIAPKLEKGGYKLAEKQLVSRKPATSRICFNVVTVVLFYREILLPHFLPYSAKLPGLSGPQLHYTIVIFNSNSSREGDRTRIHTANTAKRPLHTASFEKLYSLAKKCIQSTDFMYCKWWTSFFHSTLIHSFVFDALYRFTFTIWQN